MLNVDQLIQQKLPPVFHHPALESWLKRPVSKLLKRLLHAEDIRKFTADYGHLRGRDFVDQVLDYFDFRYTVADREREHIPSQGKLVIIANHPIGSLDGVALLKLVAEVRPDVKVIANDMLWSLEPLRPMLLPITNMGGRAGRQQIKAIHEHLAEDKAVIVFHAGEVSRLRPKGVRDTRWESGFLRIADKAHAPILPIHVEGRNSWSFYASSMMYKPLSTLLLVEEMFRQRAGVLHFRIGRCIAYRHHHRTDLSLKNRVHMLRKHLYRVGSGKSGMFPTEQGIALAEPRLALRDALHECEYLATTPDGKDLYFTYYRSDCPLMRELGRVRELTFRAIGEGTGQRRDLDRYDVQFSHLLLWDAQAMEIAGSYRLAPVARMAVQQSAENLYTASLFQFKPTMERYLAQGMELGRSFIQPQYRNRYSLDYLWQGIGAYVQKHSGVRYLFGPVSLSGEFPRAAQAMIVWFYQQWFPPLQEVATPNQPFIYTSEEEQWLAALFEHRDYALDLQTLKLELQHLGVKLPPLFKQYSELCEPGGVQFACFSVDPAFNNSIDALLIVDLHQLKPRRKQRYLQKLAPQH